MRLSKGKSYFEVISGPMFSGKTREMHRQYMIFKICNMKIQVFRRDIDKRYGEGIRTHDGIEFDKEDVFMARSVEDIQKQIHKETDVVMIDEAMLYGKDLVEKTDGWIRKGKIVIATILPTDYSGKVFGISGELLAKADFITTLNARCMYQEGGIFCHEPATMTFRKIPYKEQVLIGGTESYEARCRKHHYVVSDSPS